MEQTALDTCAFQSPRDLTLNSQPENSKQPLTNKHKFNSSEVQQIIAWISEFKQNREIFKLVQEKFGKTMSMATLLNYKNGEKWQGLIRKFREAWGREIMNVELSHKRRRLEELSDIYHIARRKNDLKLSIEALEKIKNETEKELGNLHLYNIRVYKSMSDEELETERLKTIEELKKLKGISNAGRIGEATEDDGDCSSQSEQIVLEKQGSSLDVEDSAE